jgi:hypothetical protein
MIDATHNIKACGARNPAPRGWCFNGMPAKLSQISGVQGRWPFARLRQSLTPAGRSSRKPRPSPFTLTTLNSPPIARASRARCRAQPRPAVAAAPQSLELVEDPRLFLGDRPGPGSAMATRAKPSSRDRSTMMVESFRAVANGIADQIQQDL